MITTKPFYTYSSEQLFNKLINLNRSKIINPSVYDIVSITEDHTKTGTNTRAVLKGKKGTSEGALSYFYNREKINKLFSGITITVPPNNQRNTGSLLFDINRIYGTAFKFTDIVEEPIAINDLPMTISLKMSDSNPAWIGSVDVIISEPSKSLMSIFETNIETKRLSVEIQKRKPIASLFYKGLLLTEVADTLKEIKVGPPIEEELLKTFNGNVPDEWVISDKLTPFNFHNSAVLYNGPVDPSMGDRTDCLSVLRIDLDERFCERPLGTLNVYY